MNVQTNDEFQEAVLYLSRCSHVSFDTETTGLYPYKSDRLFAIVCTGMDHSGEVKTFYWNFHHHNHASIVWDFSKIPLLNPIFQSGLRFAHNAKFDMHFLNKEGIEFGCEIHDTEVMARLIDNTHMSYSLDNCCKRDLGLEKDDAVLEYISKHRLTQVVEIAGRKETQKFFHKVPHDIIFPYAVKDAELTMQLGLYQIEKLGEMKGMSEVNGRSVLDLYEVEKRFTKTCFRIEKNGFYVDLDYCDRAIKFEEERIARAEKDFYTLTKAELVDSGEHLAPIFEQFGFRPGKTLKGNWQITDDFLSQVSHPISDILRTHRDATKRCNTYFRSFKYFADSSGRIHSNIRQGGTKTGRVSSSSPNLQNLSASDEDMASPFPVRKAFIPKSKEHALVMIDYNQMEFRMMLDYADQSDLIRKIQAGHDPHDATSELTGLTRKQAKTLNFGLLYGMGLVKLAFALMDLDKDERAALIAYDNLPDKRGAWDKLPPVQYALVKPILDKMKAFKRTYFDALPKVEDLIIRCTSRAEEMKYVRNWTGRVLRFEDPRFSYRATNAIIQGGCADVVKVAMNALDQVLPELGIDICMPVHDELVLNVPKDSLKYVDLIKSTMESVYPYRKMQLTCSVSHSFNSWGEAEEGLELVEETGDSIQGAGFQTSFDLSSGVGREDTASG